jgi:hypothetical protein
VDVTQAAISLGGVLLSALLGAALGRQAGRGDAARETALPPAPQTSQPSLPTLGVSADAFDALADRVAKLEARADMKDRRDQRAEVDRARYEGRVTAAVDRLLERKGLKPLEEHRGARESETE